MEPAPEGMIEVAGPPSSAGKRGVKMKNRDWEIVAEHARSLPWRWFRVDDESVGSLVDLRKKYPDIEMVGHNYHLAQTGKSLGMRQVCDIYVRWTGGTH